MDGMTKILRYQISPGKYKGCLLDEYGIQAGVDILITEYFC